MPGLGTLVNVATILIGTSIGVLVGHRLSAGVQQRVLLGLGMITLVLGIDLALQWRGTNMLFVLGGILLGALLGEAMAIEDRLQAFGDRLQARFGGAVAADAEGPHSTVSEGFFTASLLFCVGAMAVVGSFNDGLAHDPKILYAKALLDGFASIALASSLGWGVGLSVITVIIYQGSLTALSGVLGGVLTKGSDELLAMTSAGGIMIIGIGLKLLDLLDVKVGNYMPALVIAPLLAWLTGQF